MRLFIVRHARAFERDDERWPDDRGRPLTKAGGRDFAGRARRWRDKLLTPSLLLASPLARAWQTAEILSEHAKWPEPVACAALEPGAGVQNVIGELSMHPPDACIAVVGHEPDLHLLAAVLVSGSTAHPIVDLRKGALAELHCEQRIAAGAMTLLRLTAPR